MPEQQTKPINQYLPPRPKDNMEYSDRVETLLKPVAKEPKGFLSWLDKALEAL
jgi:hypothetical protein